MDRVLTESLGTHLESAPEPRRCPGCWRFISFGERGMIRAEFIEALVIAMLSFSLGLAVGAWLCRVFHA